MKNLPQDKRLLSILFGTTKGPLVIHHNLNEAAGNEKAFLIEEASSKNVEGYIKHDFQFILNKDQSLRWILPKLSKKPLHLSFYNQQNMKSKLYALLTNVAFKFRLKKLIVDGAFTLYVKEGAELTIHNSLRITGYQGITAFMGTVGPHRKITVGGIKNNEVTHFLKIGTAIHSIASIQKEQKVYKAIDKLKLTSCVIPICKPVTNVAHLVIENIKTKTSTRDGELTSAHINVQTELYSKTALHTFLDKETSYKEHLSIQMGQLRVDNRYSSSKLMIDKLKSIYKSLDTDLVVTSIAHGDFTPWNMYLNQENKLGIYDWEMSKRAPLLFDVFHFIYQNEILVKRGNFKSVLSQLKKTFEITELKEILDKYYLDVQTYHKWYLVENISYYLNHYRLQDILHEQAHWLLETWDAALTYFDAMETKKNTARTKCIIALFSKMKNTPYGVLKSKEVMPQLFHQNSDVDIVTTKEVSIEMVKWIKQYPLLNKVEVIKKSYMYTCKLWFKDDSFLCLDFIHEFKRRNQNFLNPQKLLVSTNLKNGVKFVSQRFDFEYIIKFYRLNGAKIPTKYMNYFDSLLIRDRRTILKHLNVVFGTYCQTIKEFNSDQLRDRVYQSIKQKQSNKSRVSKLKSNINYIYDLVHGATYNRGKVITLSGVDGAGKTTILNELVEELQNKYREEVVVLRHRPSILPIISAFKYGKKKAEKRAELNLPRTGKNKNVISSYLRFSYYLLDYSIGQFYVFFKYSLRGKTIVYDRYYFDFISDPRRSNLNIHPSLAKFLYRIVFKPNLNVLLHAPSEEVLKRKQELSKEVIEELTTSYRRLFSALQKSREETYLSINNHNKAQTLKSILDAYSQTA